VQLQAGSSACQRVDKTITPTHQVCASSSLIDTDNSFRAGTLRFYSDNWKTITSDRSILQTVTGCVIEFNSEGPPVQIRAPRPFKFSDRDTCVIDSHIHKLLHQGVLEHALHSEGEFLSNIFARAKKDGSCHLILNLNELNDRVEYWHFKMDTIETVIGLMRHNCFMASLDLSNAYFSVPVFENSFVFYGIISCMSSLCYRMDYLPHRGYSPSC